MGEAKLVEGRPGLALFAKVVRVNNDDEGNRSMIGKVGAIIGVTDPPAREGVRRDPMFVLLFSDGQSDGFWAEELESVDATDKRREQHEKVVDKLRAKRQKLQTRLKETTAALKRLRGILGED